MTQTKPLTAPHPGLRQRAQAIFDALLNAPKPETYAEIIRAARAVLTVDKMMRQLWPADEAAETADVPPAPAVPLNRQQRRAQAAQKRHTSPSLPRGEGGPRAERVVGGVRKDAAYASEC